MNLRRVCLAAALLTLAIAIVGAITEPKTCGDDRGLGPIIAFELVTNGAQVDALLTSAECRSDLRVNTWADIFAFIPAFTTFLVAGALFLGRRLAAAIFAFAAICDWVEDSVLLHLLDLPMATFEWLAALMVASRAKFFALSLGIIVLGWAAKPTARALGVTMMIGGAIALLGLPLDARLLLPGTLVAWLALFAFVLRAPKQQQ